MGQVMLDLLDLARKIPADFEASGVIVGNYGALRLVWPGEKSLDAKFRADLLFVGGRKYLTEVFERRGPVGVEQDKSSAPARKWDIDVDGFPDEVKDFIVFHALGTREHLFPDGLPGAL